MDSLSNRVLTRGWDYDRGSFRGILRLVETPLGPPGVGWLDS